MQVIQSMYVYVLKFSKEGNKHISLFIFIAMNVHVFDFVHTYEPSLRIGEMLYFIEASDCGDTKQ